MLTLDTDGLVCKATKIAVNSLSSVNQTKFIAIKAGSVAALGPTDGTG